MDLVAKAAPNGYTVLMDSSITHTVGVSLCSKLPYNVLTDFAPVSLAASFPLLMTVHPSVPAKSVKELIAYAKANPGKLNYSSPGNGTSGHLAGEMFKSMAGIEIVHVPYKGGGPAVTDLIGGQVQLTIISAVAVLPHVKSGKLRALAITSAARAPSLPDIPTVAESGVSGYDVVLWYGMFVPRNTPRAIVMRLNQEVVALVQAAEFRERLASEGGRAVGNTPEEFDKIVRQDVAKWAQVVKQAGIKVD